VSERGVSPLTITIDDEQLVAAVDGRAITLPIGLRPLLDVDLHGDPPLPEELTNAIGTVTDHLEDLVREVPEIFDHAVAVRGPLVSVVADVEAGIAQELPRPVSREALEEVFRTLVTEPARDRRRNPGLPAAEVDRVVAACCILVAVVRRLHLDQLILESA
jgi:exopolyphosphatase/guanosine-5'-triphosphate,3'-diphosphate pyrophosphatase